MTLFPSVIPEKKCLKIVGEGCDFFPQKPLIEFQLAHIYFNCMFLGDKLNLRNASWFVPLN